MKNRETKQEGGIIYMRKQIIFGSLLAMTALAAGCGKQISMNEAKTIVLEDAGITEKDAVFTKEEQDQHEFDFRFQTAKEKYEYEVNRNGKIESKSKEILKEAMEAEDMRGEAALPNDTGTR